LDDGDVPVAVQQVEPMKPMPVGGRAASALHPDGYLAPPG
jgi:hypothetical protein